MVTADLDLRPERHDKLTGKLLPALQGWIPGSVAQLRGSLGAGIADGYSDIDICWVVPDWDFTEVADTLGAALSQCTAVLALRTDPEFARSARRRVVFARLHGMPLFWRVDIDIRANSVAVIGAESLRVAAGSRVCAKRRPRRAALDATAASWTIGRPGRRQPQHRLLAEEPG